MQTTTPMIKKWLAAYSTLPTPLTGDYSASKRRTVETRVVSLVCTEVTHYDISSCSIWAALLMCPYLLKKCADYFQSSKRVMRGGRIGEQLCCYWVTRSESYLPPSLKFLYCRLHLKFLWTPQGTAIYGTIKYNLRGYSCLNHELTNCSDVEDRSGKLDFIVRLICILRWRG